MCDFWPLSNTSCTVRTVRSMCVGGCIEISMCGCNGMTVMTLNCISEFISDILKWSQIY